MSNTNFLNLSFWDFERDFHWSSTLYTIQYMKSVWLYGKGNVQKKKNLEFSRFGLTHPPHPCNRKKSGKKIMLLKCFLSNFETFFFFWLHIKLRALNDWKCRELICWVDRPCPGDSKKVWHLYVCLKISAVDLDNPIN